MKKRILSLSLALALALGLTTPAALAAEAAERGVITYTVAIAPQYEAVGSFSEGLAPAKQDGKWGYINTDGEVVIPFQYERAFAFSEGKAVVCPSVIEETYDWGGETGTYIYYTVGFIDTEGNYTPFLVSYDDYDLETGAYSQITQPVCIYQDYFGWEYNWLDEQDINELCFHNGYVILHYSEDSVSGFFDADGYCMKTAGWEAIAPVNEGLFPVFLLGEANGFGWMDAQGNLLYSFLDNPENSGSEKTTTNILPFNQGLALVWQGTWDAESGEVTYLCGFMNTDFQWAIEPQFVGCYYSDIYKTYRVFGTTGLAMVAKDGKFGAIDKNGNTVIPFRYDQLWPVNEGYIVFKEDGKYGYLNAADLQVAIPARYEAATGFANGLAVVYDGSNAFLIDKNGNAVPGADNLDPATYFVEGEDGVKSTFTPGKYVVIEEDGKYGFGHIDYLPPLPDISEMDDWAYDEVIAAIEEDLVPVDMQNLYLNDITRDEFCDLVIQAVEEVLDKDIGDLVLERTGKSLNAWQNEYPFVDSSSSNVIAAYALGIVNGYGNGTFLPYASISREEAAALLMRAASVLGMDTTNITGTYLADSGSIGVWFIDAVNFVYQINVMTGVGGDRFDPQGTYTREQAYMTIYRLFLAVVESIG